VNYERLKPILNITQPDATNVTLSVKGTSQSALAGSQTRFVKDTKFQIIENDKYTTYTSPRAVFNRRTEDLTGAGKLAGARSMTMQISMNTTDPFVSPLIDMEGSSVHAEHVLISKQAASAATGFNVPLSYVSEASPSSGTESAKHITKITTLTDEAVGLKILLAANRPPEADFQIWYRVATGGDNITAKGWVEQAAEKSLQPDTNSNIFREYRYIVGGDGGNMSPFTQFQVKIVMRSSNTARSPSFRDLRIIALAV